MVYPFSIGDLRDSYFVLCKNVESNVSGKLPWADLKFIIGEIMYGGHIVDNWDRLLCNAYLDGLMDAGLCMDEFELLPFVDGKGISLKTPPQVSFEKYLEHIDTTCPAETSMFYGLHTNSEIGLGTQQCDFMFEMLLELIPRDDSAGQGDGGDKQRNDEMYISKVLEDWNLKDKIFSLVDIKDKISGEKDPYQNVFLQECEAMNYLLEEINRSLVELKQGIKGF